MKSVTQKKKILTKKQIEFNNFVEENVLPLFEARNYKFDKVNPWIQADYWTGNKILIIIPFGDKMEPWLLRSINECYLDSQKEIIVVMGAKVNSNAWQDYVFPFADEISFVRGGKRPVAIVKYTNELRNAAFGNDEIKNIFSTNYHRIDPGSLIFNIPSYLEYKKENL